MEKTGLKYNIWRKSLFGITVLASLFLFGQGPVSAEIYRYVDRKGVWHFTNRKTDTRYRLFIRSGNRTVKEYLVEYHGIVKRASDQFGVDIHFIKAIIRAESGFDQEAVSKKGAKGLMQLMPGTASDMEVIDPLDPEENIVGGTRYFSLLLKRFKNNKALALAAYNAGPENVENYNGIPPFPETKAFVERVMRYYRSYKNGGN
ncbi:MAG: lytic transglycosylase domain-containing protein [Deltaproteobacteria bacterium]|nr:lytic transglycosylase domain-containing protein [Deltaproteobacteria bacterium]